MSTLTNELQIYRGAQIPGAQVRGDEYFIDLLNICGPSGWYLLHVTILEHRILRGRFDIWIICALAV